MEKILKNRHLVYAILIGLTFIGILGFVKIKQNLFPDTDRPQISVVIIEKAHQQKIWLKMLQFQLKKSFIL